MNDISTTVPPKVSIDDLKTALLANISSDVLKIQDQLDLVKPLITQLIEALPASMDVLRSGVIDTLEEINNGIKEAGGERTEYVKGQLSAFIERCIDDAFKANSERTEQLLKSFEKSGTLAAQNLKQQYDAVSSGMATIQEKMAAVKQEVGDLRMPKWVKICIPLSIVTAIAVSSVVTWQIASYKEAVYASAFNAVTAKNAKK